MTTCKLDKILEPGGISVVAQPIVSLAHGFCTVHAVECLTRGPAGTPFHPPSVLFEYARLKHAENRLDRHAIATGLANASQLAKSLRISVNAHASTLGGDAGFVDFICETAQRWDIELSRLIVEVVEHSPSWNISGFLHALRQLRQLGIQVALDDVGTGQSNYRMILDAEPDCFKIDAYLVQMAYAEQKRRSVLASVVALAHDLGSTVVAEGVEETQDLDVLLDLGVELIQGYLFSRPLPMPELPDVIARINQLAYVRVPRQSGEADPAGAQPLPVIDYETILTERQAHAHKATSSYLA